jgi:hypothetical protein
MAEDRTNHRKVSEILGDLARQNTGERVRLADLVNALGDRAFGVLILIFALPNAVGLGTIPGLSTIFGVPQLFVAAQMAIGMHSPWLPRWLLEKSIARSDFALMVEKSMPYLLKAERVLRERWPAMSSAVAERFLGVVFFAMAAIVSLPIPFGNQPPAVAMAFISLGLIERDGLYIVIGLGVAVLAVAIAGTVVLGGAAAIYLLIQHMFAGG